MENNEILNAEPETIIEFDKVSMEFFMSSQKVDNLKEFFIRLIK